MFHKYKVCLIYLLLLVVLSLQFISAKEISLKGVTITIDPGHGGRDSGAIFGKIMEKDLNLSIAKELFKILKAQKAQVYLIRDSDIDLSSIYDSKKKRADLYRRIMFIEKKKSDIYLSIHINWYQNSYYHGGEIYYNKINSTNKLLADFLQESFNKELGSKRSVHQTSLYIYRNTKVPGVLIECGYLSNHHERYLLQTKSYQHRLAIAITDGVISYLKNK